MNWPALLIQVEEMMTESSISLTEFKGILSTTDWYKDENWRHETWNFGRGIDKAEVTFEGIRAMFEWMGMEKALMEAMRTQIEHTVDELIRNYADEEAQRDLIVEHNEMVEGEAA